MNGLLSRTLVALAMGLALSACGGSGGGSGQTGTGGAPSGGGGSGGVSAGSGGGSGVPATGGSSSGGDSGLGGFASGGSGGVSSTGGSGGAGTGGRAAGGAGGAAGSRMGSGGAGGPGGTLGAGGAIDPNKRHLLLRDEAQSMVSYVDLGNPAANWHVVTASGRDLQLIGGGRFMIGTDNGYEERTLATGALVTSQAKFAGTQTAHRLRNGNTILAGVDWQGGTGIVLVEVNAAGAVQHTISFAGFTYVRLIRQTPTGTFLVAADNVLFEGDATGTILWRAKSTWPVGSHIWQALRIPTGETVVSTGYAATIQIFGADGSLHKTITGPTSVVPYFFGGFQILPTGDFVIANWQGHMGEHMGVQLLEYNPQGTLVWSYKPNLTTESLSLHHVIVLDGLDVSRLNVDDTTGVLVPVP